MKTVKIKTAEAIGPALDWLVAMCEGVSYESYKAAIHWMKRREPDDNEDSANHAYEYSSQWACGGPIIEREKIDLAYHGGNGWRAAQVYRHDPATSYGPTVLIAAMRCYVTSKLGDEIEIPEELT